MLEFLQQALVLVLTLASLISAPLSVLGAKNIQHMAAVGSVSQSAGTPVLSVYNGMSPTILSNGGQRQMWLSGKPTKNAADGVIYTSFYDQESGWFEPRPVFSVAGYQVSDPSVVIDPAVNGRYRMYYSVISKTDAASSTLLRLNNHIGSAHSDDGVEWVDDGVVIGQNNGLDDRGGWSPSATVMGDEIWLYYSTNYPDKVNVYRTRLSATGKKLETQRVLMVDQNSQKPLEGFNVDVHLSRDIGKYVMFLNKDFTGVVRYVSDDGITWSAAQNEENPVIQAASSSLVAAPTVEMSRDEEGREQYNLFFVGGPISKGLFEGVYQAANVSNFDAQVTFVDPKAKDYDTWSSAGSDRDSSGSSGSGGSMGGLLAVGAVGVLGIAALVGFNFLTSAAPAAATAAGVATGGSFGGRIITILPCVSLLGPSVWVTLKPSGLLLPPYMYIWTPLTLLAFPTPGVPPLIPPTPAVPSLPPRNIGQQMLGRFDIPYWCCLPPSVPTPVPLSCVIPSTPPIPVPPLPGLRMQTMGTSPAA